MAALVRPVAWLALAAALSGPAAADDVDPHERIRRLEEALERQTQAVESMRRDLDAYRAEQAETRRPTRGEIETAVADYLAGAPADFVARPEPSGPRGLRWGGYLSLEFLDPPDAPSKFDLHRLILQADVDVTPCVDFSMEVEIEHGGVSDEIEGEIVLEKAEVTFHLSDAVNPQVGWLLVPFGRYNLHHDDPMNDFTRRPFTATFLVPTGFGQPGIGAEGAFPLRGGHVLSYDVAMTNGYRDAFTADEGVREARQAKDENDGKQVWGRAAVRWETGRLFDVLETGLSGTWGVYDVADENAIVGVAVDLLLRRGPFELKGEYVAYDIERDADDPPDAIEGQAAVWVEAAWHLFPEAWRCRRGCLVTDTSHVTLAARWQWMDLDDRAKGVTFEDDLEALTLAVNYRVTERSVFRIDHTWYLPWNGEDETEWTASFSTYF